MSSDGDCGEKDKDDEDDNGDEGSNDSATHTLAKTPKLLAYGHPIGL